jgi:hypothetical protein
MITIYWGLLNEYYSFTAIENYSYVGFIGYSWNIVMNLNISRCPMLVTITYTGQSAIDPGYLLHENPQRMHSFELSFGMVYVFLS